MTMKTRFVNILMLTFTALWARSTELVKIDNHFTISFPSHPDALDTLGQKVYDYSDANGYYAVIVQPNSIKEDKLMDLDLSKFYQTMYEKLQMPSQQCQMINKSQFNIGDIQGVEFFTRCAEDPEFPDIRYKRMLVYKSNLYIIDHWAYKPQLATAEQNKNTFFLSMTPIKDENEAIIPSGIPEPTAPSDTSIPSNYIWIVGLVLALGLILLFSRKNSKK